MAALVCTVGIAGIYFVGRMVWGRAVGLVSALLWVFPLFASLPTVRCLSRTSMALSQH